MKKSKQYKAFIEAGNEYMRTAKAYNPRRKDSPTFNDVKYEWENFAYYAYRLFVYCHDSACILTKKDMLKKLNRSKQGGKVGV